MMNDYEGMAHKEYVEWMDSLIQPIPNRSTQSRLDDIEHKMDILSKNISVLIERHTALETIVKDIVIEYEDMTPEQQAIVDAGNEIAGTFPSNLTREEMGVWMQDTFHFKDECDGLNALRLSTVKALAEAIDFQSWDAARIAVFGPIGSLAAMNLDVERLPYEQREDRREALRRFTNELLERFTDRNNELAKEYHDRYR